MDLALKSNNFIFYSRQISYVPSFDILAIKSTLVKVKLDEKVKVQFLFVNSYVDYSGNVTFAGRFSKIFSLI